MTNAKLAPKIKDIKEDMKRILPKPIIRYSEEMLKRWKWLKND